MRFFVVLLVIIVLEGCADSATTKAKLDSTVSRIDSTADAVWDSTKEKARDIKGNLDSTFKKKDSTN